MLRSGRFDGAQLTRDASAGVNAHLVVEAIQAFPWSSAPLVPRVVELAAKAGDAALLAGLARLGVTIDLLTLLRLPPLPALAAMAPGAPLAGVPPEHEALARLLAARGEPPSPREAEAAALAGRWRDLQAAAELVGMPPPRVADLGCAAWVAGLAPGHVCDDVDACLEARAADVAAAPASLDAATHLLARRRRPDGARWVAACHALAEHAPPDALEPLFVARRLPVGRAAVRVDALAADALATVSAVERNYVIDHGSPRALRILVKHNCGGEHNAFVGGALLRAATKGSDRLDAVAEALLAHACLGITTLKTAVRRLVPAGRGDLAARFVARVADNPLDRPRIASNLASLACDARVLRAALEHVPVGTAIPAGSGTPLEVAASRLGDIELLDAVCARTRAPGHRRPKYTSIEMLRAAAGHAEMLRQLLGRMGHPLSYRDDPRLQAAVLRGEPAAVAEYLAAGFQLDASAAERAIPDAHALHLALRHAPPVFDLDGLLMRAAAHRDGSACVRLLLARGAQPTFAAALASAACPDSLAQLAPAVATAADDRLFVAAAAAGVTSLRVLVEHLRWRPSPGAFVSIVAARPPAPVVELLLDVQPDLASAHNAAGWAPLDVAAGDVPELLLRHGAEHSLSSALVAMLRLPRSPTAGDVARCAGRFPPTARVSAAPLIAVGGSARAGSLAERTFVDAVLQLPGGRESMNEALTRSLMRSNGSRARLLFERGARVPLACAGPCARHLRMLGHEDSLRCLDVEGAPRFAWANGGDGQLLQLVLERIRDRAVTDLREELSLPGHAAGIVADMVLGFA